MSEDYREMWGSLGLNLEAHQGLLAVLSDAYQGSIFRKKTGRLPCSISTSWYPRCTD